MSFGHAFGSTYDDLSLILRADVLPYFGDKKHWYPLHVEMSQPNPCCIHQILAKGPETENPWFRQIVSGPGM
jgi:hypothetical protein